MFETTTSSEAETVGFGRRLGGLLRGGDVVVLSGDLGAGKTRMVTGMASALGVSGDVTSPTFNILVVHDGEERLNHFDLYRLEREDQLVDIDFWGVLEGGGVSVVEWGDRFPDALPPGRLDIELRMEGETERRVSVVGRGERGSELEDLLQAETVAQPGAEQGAEPVGEPGSEPGVASDGRETGRP